MQPSNSLSLSACHLLLLVHTMNMERRFQLQTPAIALILAFSLGVSACFHLVDVLSRPLQA